MHLIIRNPNFLPGHTFSVSLLLNHSYRNVSFVQGDAMDLPFADNTFQAVTNGFALRNVVDIQKTISEMARVTAPGGRVVCIDVSVPQFFLSVYSPRRPDQSTLLEGHLTSTTAHIQPFITDL